MKRKIYLLLFLWLTLAVGCAPSARRAEYDVTVLNMTDEEIYALNAECKYKSETVCRADGAPIACGEIFLLDTGGADRIALSALDAEGRPVCDETFEREPGESLAFRLVREETGFLRFICDGGEKK